MSTSTLPALATRMAGVTSSPVRDLLALTTRPGVISFAGGLPAPELFDTDGLRAAFDRVLSGPSARRNLQYSPTEGDPGLRELLAARLTGRGLPTEPDGVLVTTGSQQALTLVAATLLDPGSVVLVEEPAYLSALQCFQLAGARVLPVPCDDDGIDPAALAELVVRARPRLLYLVPTFSNPTGRTLPAPRRRAVAELAAQHGFWIVEDDPYGELRYRGAPLTPISALPEAEGRSLYLGSFSKIVAPGMRLGWLRAPRPAVGRLTVAKQAADLHTSTVDQAAAAEYLRGADLEGHLRGLCGAYRLRRDAMLAALPSATPTGTRWTDPDGGMFVWLRLPGDADATRLLPLALRRDVAFVPGAPFYVEAPDPATLRLSFTTHTPEEITEGLRRLGRVLT
ncbi:PLP-dependent aminotransferase family protein [Amycolatopsis nigrescens]|uniref:aminotransferase-like domain-containing protein n=1 Tax=Amycolatopsis nigrescens TaxID=381445 RepID=UPI000376CA8E|nr:PLP-dependent aminotransferase family protein [Amycolatopsis nigrescens]